MTFLEPTIKNKESFLLRDMLLLNIYLDSSFLMKLHPCPLLPLRYLFFISVRLCLSLETYCLLYTQAMSFFILFEHFISPKNLNLDGF